MKVLLINGSPNKQGCTYTALNEMSKVLNDEGIETEIYYIGKDPIAPCRACRACGKIGRCVINDKVNEFVEHAREFDGYVIGSPVHYGSASGVVIPFLDRAFFVDFMSGKDSFKHKPGTAIVSARRAGTTASYDVLNKYIGISSMLQVPSTYWNGVHGSSAEDVLKDEEGVTVMRAVASNMAWLLKLLDSAKGTELEKPVAIKKAMTNFIR